MRQNGLSPSDAADITEAAAVVFSTRRRAEEAERALEELCARFYAEGRGSTAALGEAAGRSKSWAHNVVSRQRRHRPEEGLD